MVKMPASEVEVEGWDEATAWISVSAATVFATTLRKESQGRKGWR